MSDSATQANAPAKPTIIIVPGGFHTPFHYSSLTSALTSAGYKVLPLQLPSINDGSQAAPDSRSPSTSDVIAIKSAIIEELRGYGSDIVLVMHSYGGIPGSEACHDLSKTARQRRGCAGGVIALCYIAAYVVPVGRSLSSYLEEFGKKWPDYYEFEGYNNAYIRPSPDAPTRYYSDLSPTSPLYRSLSSQLQLQAKDSFEFKLTYPAYRYIPSTYLLTTKDPAMPVWLQERFCANPDGFTGDIEKGEGTFTVVRMESGHCPWLRFPEETAMVVGRVAGESV